MIIFDASTRDECKVESIRTNTPLQALVMMNDPTVLEASRVLAARLLNEHTSIPEKIGKAFRLIASRTADEKEMAILEGYHQEQLKILSDPATAKDLLEVGEYVVEGQRDETAWAALMQVVQTIYNLEEVITKQ